MAGALFSPRLIGVSGSSKELPPDAVTFCIALGRRLGSDRRARIVSGGTRRRQDSPEEDLAADWLIVNAACEVIGRDHELERVITVVRDNDPNSLTKGFSKGTKQHARGKTSEARRISFVRELDALIAVGGRHGTAQELALAMDLNKRVLPVPTFEGTARDFWGAYKSDLIPELGIDEDRARRWENPPDRSEETLQALANDMVDALFASLPRRCFVIMPFSTNFDELYKTVIAPAVEAAGDQPLRVDHVTAPGEATKTINDGIKNCDYAIGVLDGMRPNVLYEIGLAHGQLKPTILLIRAGTYGAAGTMTLEMPFDLYTHQRFEYPAIDERVAAELAEKLRRLSIRRLPAALASDAWA